MIMMVMEDILKYNLQSIAAKNAVIKDSSSFIKFYKILIGIIQGLRILKKP